MRSDEFISEKEVLGRALRALRETPVPGGPPEDVANSLLRVLTGDGSRQTGPGLAGVKRPRSVALKLALGMSLAGFLAAAALVAFLSKPKTLYAQIAEAMGQVKSLHMVQTWLRDGRHDYELEVYYDRQLGLAEEERHQRGTYVRIDDGRYEWRYAKPGDLVARLPSYRRLDGYAEHFISGWRDFNPVRDPAKDLVADAETLRAYRLSDPMDATAHMLAWVDDAHRVRRHDLEYAEEGASVQAQGALEYDAEIPPERFVPQYGKDAVIVDPRGLLEKLFPLEGPLFVRESLGMVFAVHELRRSERGLTYLVCSNRITDETREKIGQRHRWTYHYGQSDVKTRISAYSEGGWPDVPLLLARMEHDGIQVDWYLIAPGTLDPTDVATCDVDVTIDAVNQLEEKLKADGLETSEKFRLKLALPEQDAGELTIADVGKKVYAAAVRLAPIVHRFDLREAPKTGGGSMRWRRPFSISGDAYGQNIQREASRLLDDAARRTNTQRAAGR